MKLPEKFKGIYTEQGQILDAREAKINQIIDYLDEQYEQQKPKTLSKELCIKGGNVACICESCNEVRKQLYS